MIQAQLSISFISFKNISCIPIFSSIFLTLYNHEAIKLKNSFFVYLDRKSMVPGTVGETLDLYTTLKRPNQIKFGNALRKIRANK